MRTLRSAYAVEQWRMPWATTRLVLGGRLLSASFLWCAASSFGPPLEPLLCLSILLACSFLFFSRPAPDQGPSSEPYVLFYRRRKGVLRWAGMGRDHAA